MSLLYRHQYYELSPGKYHCHSCHVYGVSYPAKYGNSGPCQVTKPLDRPYFCAMGGECLTDQNHLGRKKVGAILENPLSRAGVEKLMEWVANDPTTSVVAKLVEAYSDYLPESFLTLWRNCAAMARCD